MSYVGVCGPKGIRFQYFICIWLPVNLHQVFGSLLVTMKCDHFDFCVNANKLDYHSDTYEAPIILHDWIWEIGGPHVMGLPLCKNPGGRGYLPGYIFAGYVPLASQSPYPVIVYSVANYTLHLSHFWTNINNWFML